MKFKFTTTDKVDTKVWDNTNKKLEQDLHELIGATPSEEEVDAYLQDMIRVLKPVENETCEGMLFLMYDEPSSMPADARVRYVYRPTYLAATIMMTAINRYENIAKNEMFLRVTHDVLEAAMGRNFSGAGYAGHLGFLETLRIFAQGDTLSFIERFPEVNERFACKLEEALAFLENDICTGKIKDAWSGEDYSAEGKEVLAMYQKTHETTYVWYACYGSNLNKERFMQYICRCADKTPPVADRPFMFEHSIYFAKSAARWQNGGKAFLDDSKSGTAYGRIYKITREQYEEVKGYEGSDYTKQLSLGEIEGIPVFSFTGAQTNIPTRMPSDEYFETILNGLKECYGGVLTDAEMTDYLIDAILPANTFPVLRAIRENAHYITNAEISAATGMEVSEVTSATSWLIEHRVIQQDQRSICAGHRIDDSEAYFFTVDSPCGRGLISAMLEALSVEEQVGKMDFSEGETEGNRRYVLSSRIERSRRNRIDAISLHGYVCEACEFDFERVYGELGRNYIEVHHVNPLAEQGGEQIVNPKTDLVCLCANCHRMIHRNRHKVLSVDELKNIVRNR